METSLKSVMHAPEVHCHLLSDISEKKKKKSFKGFYSQLRVLYQVAKIVQDLNPKCISSSALNPHVNIFKSALS